MIIGIDPGAKGAIAWKLDTHVDTFKMPDTPTDIFSELMDLRSGSRGVTCVLESAGFHVAGNNASASCKFARHCDHVEMALIAAGIPFESIHPTKWMKHLGAMPKDKAERKRHIKDLMQRLYPHIDVTLINADALGILTWATRQ